jgi:dipeptidyl aminopeptidase/acylaminoacyl peptidase
MLSLACVALVATESDGARAARAAAPAPARSVSVDVALPPPPAAATVAAAPRLMFRHTGVDARYNLLTIAPLDRLSAGIDSGLHCERVSFGGDRGLCLQADRRLFTTYKAVVFDRATNPVRSITLDGSPSRTRVSADGRVGAVTVFVTGHGYSSSKFSTRTTLVDMASGEPIGDLEQFGTWRDGRSFKAEDFNFWGVTFARDSNTFYASLGTNGKTYLLKGDLGLRKFIVLDNNVECPSLSPDNRLIVFKRRVGTAADAWRLYVLDLATMTDHPLTAETRFVDDQVEWLDNGHVLYALQRPSSATSDVWIAPIDGSAPARLYLEQGHSPIVMR